MATEYLFDYRLDGNGVASIRMAYANASDRDARMLHDDLQEQGVTTLYVSPRHTHACAVLGRSSNLFGLQNPGETGDKRFTVRQLGL